MLLWSQDDRVKDLFCVGQNQVQQSQDTNQLTTVVHNDHFSIRTLSKLQQRLFHRVIRFYTDTRQRSELANRMFKPHFSLMQPIEREIEPEPTLAPILVIHDRQDSGAGFFEGFHGGQDRIRTPKNNSIRVHEISNTFLAK